MTQAITEMLDKRAALYSQVATGVRSGAFKDRILYDIMKGDDIDESVLSQFTVEIR